MVKCFDLMSVNRAYYFPSFKHDKLIRCTYDTCWYNIEVKDQKKLKLLLQATQQDVYIEYFFGALNLPLFLEVFAHF